MVKNNDYAAIFDIDKIFPEDWYVNVTKATNYVLENMKIPPEKVEEVLLSIVDYNINKQLNEKVFGSVKEDLPQYLSFVDTPSTSLFQEFKRIIEVCDICSSFKEHITYFQITDDKDFTTLNFWVNLAKKQYSGLKFSLRKPKSEPFCAKLIIRKK